MIPQRVGRQPVCLRASQTQRANQSPPLIPAEPENTEESTGYRRGLGNDDAIYLDVIEVEHVIVAIGLRTSE